MEASSDAVGTAFEADWNYLRNGADTGSLNSARVDELDSSDDSDSVSESVLEELKTLNISMKGINGRYRLLQKIGEGTFSSVYKAEDELYDCYENPWDVDQKNASKWSSPPLKKPYRSAKIEKKYVALKKIYVTSSPARIQNELELLYDLAGCDAVVPLITAFRHDDQVIAVLPYFKHVEFREYYSSMEPIEMRLYFRSLFRALHHVHSKGIIHRDIKPSKRRGVLVDFGLAEREPIHQDPGTCKCTLSASNKYKSPNLGDHPPAAISYLRNDTRSAKRANRADDTEALLEIATIFGRQKTRECALLHGCTFETSIPTIAERGHTMIRLIEWANQMHPKTFVPSRHEELTIEFMETLLQMNCHKRSSAEEALRHPFLANIEEDEQADDAVALFK